MSKIVAFIYLLLSSFIVMNNTNEVFDKAFEEIDIPNIVSEDIILPEYTIVDGELVYFSYGSTNQEVISNDGIVKPRNNDTIVTIYCKAEYNGKSKTKPYYTRVSGRNYIPIDTDFDDYYLGNLIEFILPEGYNREDFEWRVSDDSKLELDEDYLGYLCGLGNVTVSIYKENKCFGEFTFEIINQVPSLKVNKDFVLIGEEFSVELSNYDDINLFDIESSDESIVKYENGKFIAKNEGECIITYRLKDDSRIFSSVEMIVYDNTPIIKVYDTELVIGKSMRIYVENYENESDYKIEVSNTELADLDGMKLIAKKSGIVTIKVSLTSDPNIYTTFDIKIANVLPEVYVLAPNIVVGGKTYLSIKNLDLLITNDFEFINKTPDIASIEGNVITGLKEGVAEFEVRSKSVEELKGSTSLVVSTLTSSKLPDGEVGAGPLLLTLEGNKETYMAGEKIRVDILGALDLEKYKLVASDSSLINTLEDGHIITKAEGRATVTAINKENNEIKGQVNIIIEGKADVDYIERLIATAESQLGYKETADGLTKYGIWYGIPDGAWCAMFVTWCAHNSGISTDIIPFYCGCTAGMKWFVDRNQFGYKETYIPKRGDIIFFLSDGAGHTGIVTGCSGNTVYTIEGNTSNMCARRSYNLNHSTITGYGIPEYE